MDINIVYKIFDKLKELAEAQNFKTVTFGTIDEVDLNRQNIYPLFHILMPSASQGDIATTFTINIIAADIVDVSKEIEDSFSGDNTIDILQEILQKLHNIFKGLQLRYKVGDSDEYVGYDIMYNIEYSSFKERFTNLLSGWTVTCMIQVQNIDNLC